MKLKKVCLILSCLGLGVLLGCRQEYALTGETMGTTYQIKVVAGPFADVPAVQHRIDERLEQVNQSMSTYRDDSEISRFNALAAVGTPFRVSTDFQQVMVVARDLYRITQGAWDGTVNPLVNLWGFGKDGVISRVPSLEAIQVAVGQVGFHQIEVSNDGYLVKKKGAVSLDLASIAKGYGADSVAALLHEAGFQHFLVEIGGEIVASGQRPDGKAWRVGINQPSRQAAIDAVYEVVGLADKAMATSGDYRNFYQIGDQLFSHIIDPRTGYPVQNQVVSTSVIAETCTFADGLATALMVMGPEKGVALLDALPGVEGVIILRHGDGRLENFPSFGLAPLLR